MIDLKKTKIYLLRSEAEREVYAFIDKYHKKLPKKSDGTIDQSRFKAHDNDVDALRHAYVSGVYAMEYGSILADFLGRVNEYKNYELRIIGGKETPVSKKDGVNFNNLG